VVARVEAAVRPRDNGAMDSACVVVGAGPAGLAVSRALVDVGVEHVVLERREVADTWRTQRWDSFRLNTPGWMNTTLGPVEPGSFSSREEVVRLLSERAGSLPVRTHSPVLAVEQERSGFVVGTPQEQIRAATVVLASGLQNVPEWPSLSKRVVPRIRQLHAADYRNAAQLPDGAVLVVGGGQSGCQIAEDLALTGRRVYLSSSRVGRYPWLYRGRELIGWLVDCGHWDQRPEDLSDQAETRAAIAVVGSGGHSLDLYLLAQLGVTLLGRLQVVIGERATFDHSLLDNLAYADHVASLLAAKADAYIAGHAIDAPSPQARASAAPIDPRVITELDLAAAGVTSLIWCTGFTGDLSWVHTPILDSRGLPRHDRCAAPVPGLWYVGFPWLTRRRSGILYGFPTDAQTVAESVRRHLHPPPTTMPARQP
jgi:putative flavoprotein involved in K+ transport